ncbi:MAG: exosome complex protein Rrp42 [Candidatus Woesearchaeota archaeon]|nr:exosome complex protein Rrp42 [Candidatus Woesearchaeota archaeon]
MINDEMKKHLLSSLKKGIRYDGRKIDEYRDVEIEYGISKSAEGSARVRIGKTEVIVGIKLALDKPYPDTPDEGCLMVGAELLPLSSPDFELGPPSIESIELARVVDRGVREAKAIDTKKLCITKGEKVWMVFIDICAINNEGNLMDAAGLAAIAALKDTKFPKYDGVEINYREHTKDKMPLKMHPIPVTVYKIGDTILVDPNLEEEQCFDARLTVTTTEKGNLCALQKGGDSPLKIEDIDAMMELGMKKSSELRKHIR